MKRTLKDYGALTPAERTLRDEVGSGLVVVIGDGTLPDADAGEDRQIRASFLRYLALGGCDKCRPSEKGLEIAGAVIISDGSARAETPGFDLEACQIDGDLGLFNCHFPDAPLLRGTRVGSLYLNGSRFENGIQADRLTAKGGAFLRDVTAKGEVRLLGASLGESFDCNGANFEAVADAHGRMGPAFSADRLSAKGGAFLSGITAKGEVRLPGASVDGVLDCDGARFEGGGFNLDSLKIGGGIFLRDLEKISDTLDLTNAKAGALADSPKSWPAPGQLKLDRFRYGAILGDDAPVNAPSRLDWLSRMPIDLEKGQFSPQPYEQLAQVLRDMGHPRDARKVLERKEQYQRQAGIGQLPSGSLRRPLRRAWNWILRWTVGYGHYPLRAGIWLIGLWAFGAIVYRDAYITGDFKPNSAFVLRADEWADCRDNGAYAGQLRCFEARPEAAGYPRFNAAVYSADVLLPVVALEMQEYWVPDSSKSTRGVLTRWFLWLQILAGWALTLLAVAGFSGIVKSDR